MKKILIIFMLLLVFGLIGLKVYSTSNTQNGDNLATLSPINITPKEEVKDHVTLTFAGDAMFDRGVKGMVNKHLSGDYSKLFEQITLFQEDDISFLNLEGPVSDLGYKVGSIYSFRMPIVAMPTLKNLGIDIVSFANNHVGDYGPLAFKDTIDSLLIEGIAWTGAGYDYEDAKTVRVITVNNIKVGFIGFSDVGPEWMKATNTKPGILLANDKNFTQIIQTAKSKSDVLVVSFHWGEEYQEYNDRQKYLAESAIDNGADIVVGHHPHVAQEIVFYKEKPILYSLGNFMFDQYFSSETMNGLVVQIEAKKDGSIQNLTKYKSQQGKFYNIESLVKIEN